MKAKKITREMIRGIKPGETAVFELPDYSAIESARVAVRHVKLIDRREFTTAVVPNTYNLQITRTL